MTVHNAGYLPVSQERDGTAQAYSQIHQWAAWKARVADFVAKNTGLSLVICGQFFFAAMDLCVKLLEKLDPPTPTLEVMVIRMAITVCCCITYMVANRIPNPILGPEGVRGLLVARAFSGFFGIFGVYYALNYLPLADTTVITFLNPFTVALAGHLFLGETYTRKEALAAVCGLIGVVLIARPPFLFETTVEGDGVTTFERLRAIASVLISVCGNTGSFITMRAIGSRAHPMQIMFFFSFWCIIVGLVAMAVMHESVVFPMTWQRIILLFVLGFLSVVGQFLLTVGLRYETATRCSLASYTQLLFAVVLEFVVLGTLPSLLSSVGSTIIVVAQASAVLSKQTSPPETPVPPSPPSPENDIEE